MAIWFGVQLNADGNIRNKHWSLFVSDNGQVVRNWGAADAAGSSRSRRGATLAAAKREAALLIRSKEDGASRYAATGAAVLFIAPDSCAAVDLPAHYRAAAAGQPINSWQETLDRFGHSGPSATVPPVTATPVAAAAPAPVLPVASEKTYRRPNGDIYYPRQISGLQDVALLRSSAARKEPVLLYGPPGCGKTALAEAAFPNCVTVNGNRSMEAGDLIGRWLPDSSGGYQWIDGPVVQALTGGLPLFIDEIARIDTQVLSILFPLMDGRGWIRVDERPASSGPQRIDAADNFHIIAAFNPHDGPGARIGEALWSRFTHKIEYTTDLALCRSLKVPANAIKVATRLNTMLRKDETTWAPQTRELLRYRTLAATFGESYAADNLIAEAPFDARDTTAAVVRDVYGSAERAALVTQGRA